MLKLLNVDAAGERALRVVAYFDQLGANNPDLESVIRATALIADCPAGLELSDRSLLLRFSSEGAVLTGTGMPSEKAALVFEGTERGKVWIERDGDPRDLDEFIVERFALTAAAVLVRERAPSESDLAQGFSDPALAQLLVNGRASEAERSRAARLIGLQPSSMVQLIALELGADEDLADTTARLRDAWKRAIHVAELSRNLSLVIAVGREPVEWNIDRFAGRAASGPVVELFDAPRSWTTARETLRFAGAGPTWPRALDADQLGALRLLGLIDPAEALANRDVVQIGILASGANGQEAITILDHYLHAESLRSAARAANFHHSSLQSRISRIEVALGIDLKSAAGRERAALALLLWRIFHSN